MKNLHLLNKALKPLDIEVSQIEGSGQISVLNGNNFAYIHYNGIDEMFYVELQRRPLFGSDDMEKALKEIKEIIFLCRELNRSTI